LTLALEALPSVVSHVPDFSCPVAVLVGGLLALRRLARAES
jgi:lipopolysaccharide export LptBFGC system permease protein LptF